MDQALQVKDIKNILIIGIKGGLARSLAHKLQKDYPKAQIIGIDSRNTSDLQYLHPVKTYTMNYTRGHFENLFRNDQFDVVYHVGRIIKQHQGIQYKLSKYLDLELLETRRILDLCLQTKVKKVVILSSFHVYGARPDNSIFITEDTPTRASLIYPALLNVLEIDEVCSEWIWKNQDKVEGVLLRPCHIIGSDINNDICKYLRTPYSPYPIDFNPMFQMIHQQDLANILSLSIPHFTTGIYNIAPPDYLPIKEILKIAKHPRLPVSFFALGHLSALIHKNISSFPSYLVDYLKYPCLVDTHLLQKTLPNYNFQFSLTQSIQETINASLRRTHWTDRLKKFAHFT